MNCTGIMSANLSLKVKDYTNVLYSEASARILS